MSAIPVLDLEALREVADDPRVEEGLARRVEPSLVAEGAHEDLEPLPERIVAEVVEPGLGDRVGHEIVVRHHWPLAGVNATGIASGPEMKFDDRRGIGSPARCRSGRRRSSSPNITCSSSRASDAPMQKCGPKPNARCGFGSRCTSKRSGSSNTAGSRF